MATKAPPPYDTIVFDCDSTLVTIEGIEALAGPKTDEIRTLTDRAMNGELPLEAVYGARLDLIRPSRAAVDEIGRLYVAALLPHARELFAALRALDKRVWLVSGGLEPPVRELASELGVDAQRVSAVGVSHGASGEYSGFDEDSPLAQAGGKRTVVARIIEREGGGPLALIGDGATDLEAAPLCARFVAFGGVERRAAVFAAADATCDAPDLAALLPLLTSPAERTRLARENSHATVLDAAAAHH